MPGSGFDYDSFLTATRAAPNLDPQTLYGVASANTGGVSTTNAAQAVQGFGDSTKFRSNIEAQSPGVQRTTWAALPDSERQMLTSAGYKGPPAHHQSLLGQIAGDVDNWAFKDPQQWIKDAVDAPLQAAGAGLRNVQHAFRAAHVLSDQGAGSTIGEFDLSGFAKSFTPLIHPDQWAKAWRDTTNGERTFDPIVERQLAKQYPPDTFAVAKELAGGTKPEQLVLGVPPEQRLAFIQKIHSDSELQDAVTQLQASKISFGRVVATRGLLLDHPTLGKLVSGTADAIGDWYGDPLISGLKAVKGVNEARYAVRGAEDVARLSQTPGAQRYAQLVADHIASGDVAGLRARLPGLTPVVQELVDKSIDTPEKWTGWLSDAAGQQALLEGRVTGKAFADVSMPRLSPIGMAKVAAKGALKDTIDFAADTPARINTGLLQAGDLLDNTMSIGDRLQTSLLTPVGRFARAFTKLAPIGSSFVADSDTALEQLNRVGSMALPADRVAQLENAWAAAPDIGARRGIYKGMLSEMGRAAGIDATPQGRAYLSRMLDSVDSKVASRAYSNGAIEKMATGAGDASVGFLEGHLTPEWDMPSFRDWWTESKRASITRSVVGGINNDLFNGFMDKAWKPLALLRLGFAPRVAGEELVNGIMREGLGPLKARLAASSVEGLAKGAEDRILPLHPLANVWSRMTDHLPDNVVKTIETPSDFVGQVLGDRTRRAFRNVEGALAGDRYVAAAKNWAAHEGVGHLADEVSASESQLAGWVSDGETTQKMVRSGNSPRPVELQPTGDFRNYQTTDPLQTVMWKRNLDEVAQSDWARAALEHVGDRDAQVQAVSDALLAKPGQMAKGYRNGFLRDGSQVGVDATRDDAVRDWANTIVDHVNDVVSKPDGGVHDFVGDMLADRRGPTMPALNDVAEVDRPMSVHGAEVLPVPVSRYQEFIRNGFDSIGRQMDWISRQPMLIHNYATALDDSTKALRPLLGEGANVDAIIHEAAKTRAINATIPFIHDPQIRSEFAVATRNLMPFWFAQEQFLKRWATTLVHSPEAFREAQLVMGGMRHSGMIHTDDQGNDYFMYPGMGSVQNLLVKALKYLPGSPDLTLPLQAGFSGQVKFATPGLERLGSPSFGPIAAVPMNFLAKQFPELTPSTDAALGRGAGRSYWEQVTPPTLTRLVHTVIDNPETSPQMMSANIEAMKQLEASGHGLPANASPEQVQIWQDRVKGWTRVLFFTRTLLGFAAPASPQIKLDPKNFNQEYAGLLSTLPIDQASKEFLKRHPDATAYTVFQSKSPSGAPLPATDGTLKFMDQHAEFLKAYPNASAWFIPNQSADAKFSQSAYREQMALELRQKKTPEEWYRNLKYAESADQYFTERDAKDAALKTAHGAKADTIRHNWDVEKAKLLQANPIFAEELLASDGPRKRAEALTQLRTAINDPRLPIGAQTDQVKGLLTSYDNLQNVLARTAGQRGGGAQAKATQMKQSFISWAKQYVVDNPDAKPLYDRIIRLEVGG